MSSLRTRLLAGVLLLSAAGLVLLAAVTYAEQHSFLYSRVDQEARSAVGALSVALDRSIEQQSLPGGGEGGAGGFGTFSANTSSNYIGTFVVGIYDASAKKLVWIGGAQHAIEPSKKPEKNQERLDKGARKLLKDFPPGQGK